MMCKDMRVFGNSQDCQGRMVQKATKELVFLGSKAPQDLQVKDGSDVQIQCMLITFLKCGLEKMLM